MFHTKGPKQKTIRGNTSMVNINYQFCLQYLYTILIQQIRFLKIFHTFVGYFVKITHYLISENNKNIVYI